MTNLSSFQKLGYQDIFSPKYEKLQFKEMEIVIFEKNIFILLK